MLHQDDATIPKEEELLCRLRDKYTPAISSISHGELQYPIGNDTDTLCEFLEPSIFCHSFPKILHYLEGGAYLQVKEINIDGSEVIIAENTLEHMSEVS